MMMLMMYELLRFNASNITMWTENKNDKKSCVQLQRTHVKLPLCICAVCVLPTQLVHISLNLLSLIETFKFSVEYIWEKNENTNIFNSADYMI